MTVRDIMTESPATSTPETSLRDVAQMMVDCDCGAVPVTGTNGSTGQAIGIITDRDIITRIVAGGQDPTQKTVRDAMTTSIVTVQADRDVSECAGLMEEHQVRRLIVVDDNENVIGICSQADIARHADAHLTGSLVEEISNGH